MKESQPKMVVKKGVKHSQSIASITNSQITVLACSNAGGFVMPKEHVIKSGLAELYLNLLFDFSTTIIT